MFKANPNAGSEQWFLFLFFARRFIHLNLFSFAILFYSFPLCDCEPVNWLAGIGCLADWLVFIWCRNGLERSCVAGTVQWALCNARTIFYLCFRFPVSKTAIARSIVVDDAIDATNYFYEYMRFTLKSRTFVVVVVGGACAVCQCMHLHSRFYIYVYRCCDNLDDQWMWTQSAPECVHCSLEVFDI